MRYSGSDHGPSLNEWSVSPMMLSALARLPRRQGYPNQVLDCAPTAWALLSASGSDLVARGL
jgi:hypothetical protein